MCCINRRLRRMLTTSHYNINTHKLNTLDITLNKKMVEVTEILASEPSIVYNTIYIVYCVVE